MEGRKLKNYENYLQKLKLYAKASHLKLIWRNQPEEGCYLPAVNRINIDIDLEQSIEIATILHELGHNADDKLALGNNNTRLNRAYNAFYKGKSTPSQKRLVIACELRAWELGERIASILNLRIGKWFHDFKDDCMKRNRSA